MDLRYFAKIGFECWGIIPGAKDGVEVKERSEVNNSKVFSMLGREVNGRRKGWNGVLEGRVVIRVRSRR